MGFYTESGEMAGGVILYFTSPPLYELLQCTTSRTDFFAALPTGTDDKVWRISLIRTSGIRLVIHCNDVEVLNILVSDSTCNTESSGWNDAWNRDMKQIRFDDDTASDYYRLRGRGNYDIQNQILTKEH